MRTSTLYKWLWLAILLLYLACSKQTPPTPQEDAGIAATPAVSVPDAARTEPPKTDVVKTDVGKADAGKTEGTRTEETVDDGLRILYFNSWQALLTPVLEGGQEFGGIEPLTAMIQSRKNERTLICTTGDFLPGDIHDRRPAVEAMDMMGVHVATIGNLELNYGTKGLKKKLEKARFSVVSANLYEKDRSLFPPYHIEEIGKFSVAVVGVISQDAAVKMNTDLVGELRFRDPLRELEKVFRDIPADIPAILLSDLQHQEEEEIARRFPRISLIIGRYEINPQRQFTRIGSVAIARLGKRQGMELGEVVLQKSDNGWKCSSQKIYKIGPATEDCKGLPPYPPAKKFLIAWHKEEQHLQEVLGKAEVLLEGSSPKVRQGETNFGNLLADILLQSRPGADIAVINSGFIRASIPQGDMRRAALQTALPFKNEVVELEVSAEVIRAMLENSVARYDEISGAFLQVAGLSFVFCTDRPAFSRVIEVRVRGERIDDQKIYRLVTLSYLASGGDDYAMLRDIKATYTSQNEFRELVENYLKTNKTVNPVVEGRIRIVQ